MNKKVYLAGPVTGLSYEDCVDWRNHAKEVLGHAGIIGISPLRAIDYLTSEHKIDLVYDMPLSNSKGITARSRWDAMDCDVVFINVLDAEIVSIGTVMEVAWADILRKPIILVMEDEGNPHDHPMITESVGFRLTTLDEGLEIAKAILSY